MSAPRPIRALEPVAPPPVVVPSPPRALPLRPPRSRRPLWIGLATLLALLTGLGLWQRKSFESRQNVAPFTVLARSGSLPGVVTASGELDAVERVNISPKRQGQLRNSWCRRGTKWWKANPLP